MSDASCLVYQVWVGRPDHPLYELCTQSVARYCARHRLDHVIQREARLAIQPIDPWPRFGAVACSPAYLPIFEKENAFALFDRYERICIIDSDIYVRADAPNIFDELREGAAFAGVLERDLPVRTEYAVALRNYAERQYGRWKGSDWAWSDAFGPEFYNMGVMLMDRRLVPYLRDETPEQFIRRKEFEDFVNGVGPWRHSTDQTLLNYWVRSSGMPRQNLSWKWNALFRAVRDEALPEAYFIHFFLSRKLPRRGAEVAEIVAQLEQAIVVSAPAW
jgi:hypothetical protein